MTTYTNPGAVGDVSAHADVEGSWQNAIRDRVVNTFTDATARDLFYAGQGGAIAGQCCFIESTGAFLVFAGATTGWQPPWNTKWGLLAKAISTADHATSGVTGNVHVTGCDLTFTTITNRLYRISWGGSLQIATATTWGELVLADSGYANTIERSFFNFSVTATQHAHKGVWVGALAAGSYTRQLWGQTGVIADVVTVKGTARHSYLMVEDIGPNGNPS